MGINPLKSSIDHIMDAGPGIRKADDRGVMLTKQGLAGSDNNLTWLQQSRRPIKRPLQSITTINKGKLTSVIPGNQPLYAPRQSKTLPKWLSKRSWKNFVAVRMLNA